MAGHKRQGRGKSKESYSKLGDRPEDSGVGKPASSEGFKTTADTESESGLRLDDWQREILDCREKYILLCKGRQIGGTTIMARKCADRMISQRGCQIVVISLTEDQAQLVITMVLTYLEINHKPWIRKPYSRNITKGSIRLNNGSSIISRPVGTTGDSVRGFTGHVLYLNESSRMSEFVFEAAKPILLTTDGEIWMDSTPFGKKGYFYNSFINKHKRWKVFYVSSEECIENRAISATWTKEQRKSALEFLEQEKKDMTKLQYGQEYLGKFMEDLNQLFSDELIQKLCILSGSRGVSSAYSSPHRDYFLGVDLARMGGDLISYQIIQRINKDTFHHVENINEQYKLTTHTYDKIISLNKLWNFQQIGIDAGSGSLGVGISDFLLREPSVRKKIVDLNNRKVIVDYRNDKTGRLLKEMMYFQMLMLMEQNKLFFLDDDDVRLSLKSIQYEYLIKDGVKTKIRIFGSGSKKIDHITEGLVRAVHLANSKHLNPSITWV